jgi:hypothetical protein
MSAGQFASGLFRPAVVLRPPARWRIESLSRCRSDTAFYNQRRFRLDDSGPTPEGIGEDNNRPLRLRLGWDITPTIALHFLGGVALGGEVRLENRNGNRINKQDYDPAPYIGLRFVGGF